ncbi:MAG TPA: hypothetical protein VMY76_03140 [Gemmatimonadales bacterium]|nr:hypothetical protein [Gemmatimonadales bacterium]
MRRRAWLAAYALVPMALGCREDGTSPSEPAATALRASISATTALAFIQVSGGQDQNTCGVTSEHRAYCWGRNYRGQLGDGTTSTAELTPIAVATTLTFSQVSAGWLHTCAVTPDHRAYCWGSNGAGALGDGTKDDHATPVAVTGGHQFRQVDAGMDFTCGLTYPDNRAYCWGNNTFGQLGAGSTSEPVVSPAAVVGGLYFQQVKVGGLHACGITTTNRAYCWGYNAYGRLGDSTNVSRSRPTRVAAGTRRFRQLDAGGGHTCAVTTTYKAFCWGNGTNGVLGIGKTITSFWPRAVAGGLLIRRVTAGNGHTCAETTESQVYCWGDNGQNQLGDGTTTSRSTPVRVPGGLTFAQVSAGATHTCGRTTANATYCWGNNVLGAVGDGTWQNTRAEPTKVAGQM